MLPRPSCQGFLSGPTWAGPELQRFETPRIFTAPLQRLPLSHTPRSLDRTLAGVLAPDAALGALGPVRFRGGQGLSSPVSSHSIVLPNSRAILSNISARTSTFRMTLTRGIEASSNRYNENKALLGFVSQISFFVPFGIRRLTAIWGDTAPLVVGPDDGVQFIALGRLSEVAGLGKDWKLSFVILYRLRPTFSAGLREKRRDISHANSALVMKTKRFLGSVRKIHFSLASGSASAQMGGIPRRR